MLKIREAERPATRVLTTTSAWTEGAILSLGMSRLHLSSSPHALYASL